MRRMAATGWAVALAIAAALAGCGTAPDKLKESDFNIRKVALAVPAQEASTNFRESLRHCRKGTAFWGSTLGIPDCGQQSADGSMTCNIYADKGMGMGRSNIVLGIVAIQPAPTGSTATLKVQTWVGRNHIVLDAWENYVRGEPKEVCPGK